MSVSYRDAAIALWGPAGAYAHDSYTRQRHLLPELPDQLPIVTGITAYGHCLGLTRGCWTHGPRITLASNIFAQGVRMVDDVLLHEALHAWLCLTGQTAAHDSNDWYSAIRRLSLPVLGHELDVRRGSQRRSVRVPNPDYRPDNGQLRTLVRKMPVEDAVSHGRVARWPQQFRPDGYDWGDPIDCPSC